MTVPLRARWRCSVCGAISRAQKKPSSHRKDVDPGLGESCGPFVPNLVWLR